MEEQQVQQQPQSQQMSDKLNTFFDIEEKYYYISKLEELKNIVELLQQYFSSKEKLKILKQKFPSKYKNISDKELEDIRSLLSILSVLLSDFLKIARHFTTEEIKTFYQELVYVINKVVLKQ